MSIVNGSLRDMSARPQNKCLVNPENAVKLPTVCGFRKVFFTEFVNLEMTAGPVLLG